MAIELYLKAVAEFLKNTKNIPIVLGLFIPVVLFFLAYILKLFNIPQKVISMFANRHVSKQVKKLPPIFIEWIINESKKFVTTNVTIMFVDLENVYPKKWYINRETDKKLREAIFEKLEQSGILKSDGNFKWVYSKM